MTRARPNSGSEDRLTPDRGQSDDGEIGTKVGFLPVWLHATSNCLTAATQSHTMGLLGHLDNGFPTVKLGSVPHGGCVQSPSSHVNQSLSPVQLAST